MLLSAIGGMAFFIGSCDKGTGDEGSIGTITGTVLDTEENPIAGVSVTAKDLDVTAETGTDGSYVLENVPVSSILLTFTAEKYQTTNVTVPASWFDENGHAVADIVMNSADAVLSGIVYDGDSENGTSPLSGATITISYGSKTQSVTTEQDGKYSFNNLVVQDYSMKVEHPDKITVNNTISASTFKADESGIPAVSVNVTMYETALLPGLSINDLKNADKWYYNEYRGGNTGYPNDWSIAYMSVLDFRGAWQNQGEGVAIQIKNTEADQSNAGSLDMFDSFVFGSKLITEDNKTLTINARTHDTSNPTVFGVQVIDLTAETPAAEKVGSNQSYAGSDYKDFDFDLSKYIGKEVVIAIGTYREQSGDYYRQLVLKHIAFTADGIQGAAHLTGDTVEGLDGWFMTKQMVRSTMPNEKSSFNAITPSDHISDDNYYKGSEGYSIFRGKSHIIQEWSFMYVSKDVEPHRTEGFIIKTNNDGNISTTTPSSYFYFKVPVAAGHDKITFNVRTFSSSTPTYFKVTAITEDCTVEHLLPVNAPVGSEGADKCWKAAVESYTDFTYDLGRFDGQDVMITIGVFKGENSGTEDKLCFHTISIN